MIGLKPHQERSSGLLVSLALTDASDLSTPALTDLVGSQPIQRVSRESAIRRLKSLRLGTIGAIEEPLFSPRDLCVRLARRDSTHSSSQMLSSVADRVRLVRVILRTRGALNWHHD